MFIDSITLHNYRAYRGTNTVHFKNGTKNVSVIAGNNGFGKTTFLTSIVWCLYGKLMSDVDEKFRHDINDVQGYRNYSKMNVNKAVIKQLDSITLSPEQKKYISKNGYVGPFESLSDCSTCYIQIDISDIFIPSIPCTTISIRRTFDYILESEEIEVLIDGQVNELAKEVGYDIFINDFILSKEIAKFFLFDAEKIVTLSEVKTIEEKRRLSMAYSEVLGIKKYEDIKRNLENIRIKYRKTANGDGSVTNRNKLNNLSKTVEETEKKIREAEARIHSIDESLFSLKREREALQERLIREGNAMSLDELNRQKALLNTLRARDNELKSKMREMLDLAPFAISGYQLCLSPIFRFSRGWSLSGRAMYNSPQSRNGLTLGECLFASMSLNKTIGKWDFRILLSDIFDYNTSNFERTASYTMVSDIDLYKRDCSLGVTYRF